MPLDFKLKNRLEFNSSIPISRPYRKILANVRIPREKPGKIKYRMLYGSYPPGGSQPNFRKKIIKSRTENKKIGVERINSEK